MAVPFNGKPIFLKIYNISKPYQNKIFKYLEKKVKLNLQLPQKNGKQVSKKIFTSYEGRSIKHTIQKNLDHFTNEEKTFLKNTINNYTK